MTRRRLIPTILVVAVILGLIADVIAVTQFGFQQGNPFGGSAADEEPGLPKVFVPEDFNPEPTATPTPIPPLDIQLTEALSVNGKSARGAALFKVAQHAVLESDYWTAIRAASATPYKSEQAEHLSFVVRCAMEDGIYRLAAEAADQIKYDSVRDLLKVEVIEARRLATFELDRLRYEQASRLSMACFKALSQ